METYELRNLTFRYPNGQRNALQDISLRVERGAFLCVCGPSGCGKSTLLRQLKPALTPHGASAGEIVFEGEPLGSLSVRAQSEKIGFVLQDPDNQIVTDKVWHELAFGLESLGLDQDVIRRRVAEMASFFDMESWFHKNVCELSGGQKQLLNLASVMAMQPSVLLLDEPTSQLDPIAAADFIAALGKINRELGTTVIITEHRLEDVLPLSTRIAVLDGGRLIAEGAACEVGELLKSQNHPMFLAMPTPMRVYAAVPSAPPCPITVREGRAWLHTYAETHALADVPEREESSHISSDIAVKVEQVWFKYEKNSPDVVKGLDLTVRRGEFFALLGGNGAGKTTTLRLLSGLRKAYRGKIECFGRTALLPQDVQTLFVQKTVREDLSYILDGTDSAAQKEKIARVCELCQISSLLEQHPYDLSGGEQQRAALAKLLLTDPDILLLDEPTKGFDAAFKQVFAAILRELTARGTSIIMVSHDVEFCAQYADTCALFFDGAIVTSGKPQSFFGGNRFYTTAANRMARELLPNAVTADELITACGGTIWQAPPAKSLPPQDAKPPKTKPSQKQNTLPKRTLCTLLTLLVLMPLTVWLGLQVFDGRKYLFISILLMLEALVPFIFVFEHRKPQPRELVLLATLCALGVAGRAVFAAIPFFKPVAAIVILAGAAFGAETGFLTGASTMLVSNLFFGQGPWTPWQMFAMGLLGLFAGILFAGKPPKKILVGLFIYGIVSVVIVYGGVMNPASALMFQPTITKQMFLAYMAAGFPIDLIHAGATALFLLFSAKPMLEKLTHVNEKYGLLGE